VERLRCESNYGGDSEEAKSFLKEAKLSNQSTSLSTCCPMECRSAKLLEYGVPLDVAPEASVHRREQWLVHLYQNQYINNPNFHLHRSPFLHRQATKPPFVNFMM
jgi:hypothetical protein